MSNAGSAQRPQDGVRPSSRPAMGAPMAPGPQGTACEEAADDAQELREERDDVGPHAPRARAARARDRKKGSPNRGR